MRTFFASWKFQGLASRRPSGGCGGSSWPAPRDSHLHSGGVIAGQPPSSGEKKKILASSASSQVGNQQAKATMATTPSEFPSVGACPSLLLPQP